MHRWAYCIKHNVNYIVEDGCPKCGTTANNEAWECIYCGAISPTNQFNCHNCGAPRRHKDVTDARRN